MNVMNKKRLPAALSALVVVAMTLGCELKSQQNSGLPDSEIPVCELQPRPILQIFGDFTELPAEMDDVVIKVDGEVLFANCDDLTVGTATNQGSVLILYNDTSEIPDFLSDFQLDTVIQNCDGSEVFKEVSAVPVRIEQGDCYETPTIDL